MINTIYCNIPDLRVSIPVTFNTVEVKNVVLPIVSERISVIRLPFYKWNSNADFPCTPEVIINAFIEGADLLVNFNCQLFGDSYRVDLAGFHWDFWKSIIASFSGALLSRGTIIAHAACIGVNEELVLLPGHSGDGKSSISFKCINEGLPVYASELCYIEGDQLIAGNLSASIDMAALEHFRIPMPADAQSREQRILINTDPLSEYRKIGKVYFPRVNKGSLHVRKITERRARMLLYENIFSQLPSGQMLCHNSIPISPAPSSAQLITIANQVACLIKNQSFIVEGSPGQIVTWIKEQG